jgi:hypothetical protein
MFRDAGHTIAGYEPREYFKIIYEMHHADGLIVDTIGPIQVDTLILGDAFATIERPEKVFGLVQARQIILTTPIYDGDPVDMGTWEHFRPNRTAWYFTKIGLEKFLYAHKFAWYQIYPDPDFCTVFATAHS